METSLPTTAPPAPGLFQQLLGHAWDQLDPEVRKLHEFEQTTRAAGRFYVRQGRWPSSWLAWIMGLPAAHEGIELRLEVKAEMGREIWRRSFGNQPMVSWQSQHVGGWLTERVGQFEIDFRLTVVDGALHYDSIAARVCLGPLRIPLPLWLSPKITAREASWRRSHVPDEEGIAVDIEMRLPFFGHFISYGGQLRRSG